MSFVPGWNPKPFSTLALSASGVLALADLNTIAQRTAITGGASWIDTLLLAPGIHYQQAADELFRRGGASAIIDVVDEFAGSAVTFKLRNAATAHYIQNVAKPGETVTLDVGRAVSAKGRYQLRRSDSGNHATAWRETGPSDLGWVSHALYLTSPVLTIAATAFIVVFKDWWALMSIMALMTSRLLNIWVIKQRASQEPESAQNDDPSSKRSQSRSRSTTGSREKNHSGSGRRRRLSLSATRQRISQFLVHLGDGEHKTMVRLRGKASDIRDITSRSWLRRKTHLEGYLEAAAKLIVYLVAALSGNMTQVGAIIMMVLLLTSAGLLALSNSKAKKLVVNGVAVGVADNQASSAATSTSTATTTTTSSNAGGAGGGGGGGGSGQSISSTNGGTAAAPSSSQAGGVKRVPGTGGGNTANGDGDRGRSRQDSGGATAAVMRSGSTGSGTGPSGTARGGGNPADLAERGQAGHVKWKK